MAKEIARRRNISALPLKTESDAVPMILEGRAYADALERHGFECSLRHQEYEINEVGTLLARFRVEGLYVLTGAPPCEKLRFGVALPSHGEFLSEFFGLDEDSVRRGFRRETTPSCDGAPSKHWIVPPTPLLPGGPPATYGGGYADSMMMTRWEALERTPQEHRRKGWDEEWVGVFVAYPARRFELVVRFPDSLATVKPELSCSRHPQYPDYPLDDCRHVESTAPDRLVPDRDAQREASRRLQQTEHNVWQLELDRPQVGYFYQLRWRVPGENPDPRLAGFTRIYQDMLLAFGGRVRANACATDDEQALKCFGALCQALGAQLCATVGPERLTIALLAYDPAVLALRVAIISRSWEADPLPDRFNVPLGAGVSGAAFQQRRIVVWVKTAADRSLIRPRHHPGFDAHAMLALPIYNQQVMTNARPPPWSAIGAVVVGSDSRETPLADLTAGTPECAQRLEELRMVAQTHVIDILSALTRAQMESLGARNLLTSE